MESVLEILGIAGVGMVLVAYTLLNAKRLQSTGRAYLLLNIAGSSLILLSLFTAWNLPAFVIQCAWIAISLYGLWKVSRRAA